MTRDALVAVVVDVLSEHSGASASDIAAATDLFEAAVLTSHSLVSVAVDLEERLGVALVEDLRVSEWYSVDGIVGRCVRAGAG